jgi:hypothetical protein
MSSKDTVFPQKIPKTDLKTTFTLYLKEANSRNYALWWNPRLHRHELVQFNIQSNGRMQSCVMIQGNERRSNQYVICFNHNTNKKNNARTPLSMVFVIGMIWDRSGRNSALKQTFLGVEVGCSQTSGYFNQVCHHKQKHRVN